MLPLSSLRLDILTHIQAAVIDAKHHHGGNHATYTPAWQVMGHGPRSPIIPTPMPDDPGFHGDPKIDFHGPVVVPTSETSNPKWPGGVGPVGATLHQTMSGEPSAVPAISGPYGAPLSVTGLPHPVITSAAVFWGQRKADGIDTLTTAYQTPPGRVDAKRAAEAFVTHLPPLFEKQLLTIPFRCHVTTLYGAQDQITTTICDQPPATCTPCVGCNAPQC